MAKVATSGTIGGMSGKVGGLVFARTESGTILRETPEGRRDDSEAQYRIAWNLRKANSAWRGLEWEQVLAWQAYAATLKRRNPQTGLLVAPKAYNVFIGLATKFLQANPNGEIPLGPPQGRFFGDLVQVSVEAQGPNLLYTADRDNAPGVVTELLLQRLTGRNNAPKERSYVAAGFMAFDTEHREFEHGVFPWTYAAAIRFVEAATGRMTDLFPIGRATVTQWGGG